MKTLIRFALVMTLSFVCVGLSARPSAAEEYSLLDSTGAAVAYIDVGEDSLTVYLWSGQPVAYIQARNAKFINVWGFNGTHIGWFWNGVIHDNQGYVSCVFTKDYAGTPQPETPKGTKQQIPAKEDRDFEIERPPDKAEFSSTSCADQLADGVGG